MVDRPPGHHDRPLSEGELRGRFLTCAAHSLDADEARRAVGRLGTLRGRELPAVVDALVE